MNGSNPPNARQVELIQTVVRIIKTWSATNDISSPTHSSDIMEELRKLDLDEKTQESVYRHILNIWFEVLTVK